MADPPFDIEQAHRWFAVELNNVAWDLVDADQRGEADTERMLHAAHAACYHWMRVGSAVNHQRALCLLATAYAYAGLAEPAGRYAAECVALSECNGDEQTAFDRATSLGCLARACAAADRVDDANLLRAQAREAAAAIDNDEERQYVEGMLAEGPWFGVV